MDAEIGSQISQGMIAEHDAIDAWSMDFPDYKDPIIVFVTGEMAYECRYNAIIGKSPGALREPQLEDSDRGGSRSLCLTYGEWSRGASDVMISIPVHRKNMHMM